MNKHSKKSTLPFAITLTANFFINLLPFSAILSTQLLVNIFLFLVLDMSRHIPLYHAVLSLLRALASVDVFIPLLTSMKGQSVVNIDKSNTLIKLLTKLKACVDTYQKRLK